MRFQLLSRALLREFVLNINLKMIAVDITNISVEQYFKKYFLRDSFERNTKIRFYENYYFNNNSLHEPIDELSANALYHSKVSMDLSTRNVSSFLA